MRVDVRVLLGMTQSIRHRLHIDSHRVARTSQGIDPDRWCRNWGKRNPTTPTRSCVRFVAWVTVTVIVVEVDVFVILLSGPTSLLVVAATTVVVFVPVVM